MHLGRKFGRVLPVGIAQHSSTKKSFNKVALACTFVTNSPFSNKGGILTDFGSLIFVDKQLTAICHRAKMLKSLAVETKDPCSIPGNFLGLTSIGIE